MMDVRASDTETQPFCSGPLPSPGPVSSLSSVSALHSLVYTGSLIAAVGVGVGCLEDGNFFYHHFFITIIQDKTPVLSAKIILR